MLKFLALYKQKITGISNTAFYNQIGISINHGVLRTTKKGSTLL